MDFTAEEAIRLIIMLIILLFSATIHELSHGWVALREGDPTAKMQNRLTLNPIPHIDLFMSIIVPLVLFISTSGQYVFGGAKPVPVNPYYLKNGKNSMLKVAAAGPGSNFGLAIIGAIIFRMVTAILGLDFLISPLGNGLYLFLSLFVYVNLLLMLFNLLPIPPLDGSKILEGLLPSKYGHYFRQIESYGMLILIVVLFSGILSYTLFPLLVFTFKLMMGV